MAAGDGEEHGTTHRCACSPCRAAGPARSPRAPRPGRGGAARRLAGVIGSRGEGTLRAWERGVPSRSRRKGARAGSWPRLRGTRGSRVRARRSRAPPCAIAVGATCTELGRRARLADSGAETGAGGPRRVSRTLARRMPALLAPVPVEGTAASGRGARSARTRVRSGLRGRGSVRRHDALPGPALDRRRRARSRRGAQSRAAERSGTRDLARRRAGRLVARALERALALRAARGGAGLSRTLEHASALPLPRPTLAAALGRTLAHSRAPARVARARGSRAVGDRGARRVQ